MSGVRSLDSKTYCMLLSMVQGLGPRWQAVLTEAFGSPEQVWHAGEDQLHKIPRIPRKVIIDILAKRESLEPQRVMQKLKDDGISVLYVDEPMYPHILKEIYDPPKILYVKGDPRILQQTMVAIVGARKASPYGLAVAEKIAGELADAGLCVISGMARGIDTAAHRGALGVSAPTAAVLGCGVDVVYPPENRRLMAAIIENGAVISEFPPGTQPVAGNFPQRNRLISGLARGVLIIEAAERSGSLITADFALEQGRDVFALPGQVTNPLNKGAHRLIKQGARLVEDARDILEEFGLVSDISNGENEKLRDQEINLTANEKRVYNVVSDEPVSSEVIIANAGLEPSEVLALLLVMEMKGIVRLLPGERYIRSPQA